MRGTLIEELFFLTLNEIYGLLKYLIPAIQKTWQASLIPRLGSLAFQGLASDSGWGYRR